VAAALEQPPTTLKAPTAVTQCSPQSHPSAAVAAAAMSPQQTPMAALAVLAAEHQATRLVELATVELEQPIKATKVATRQSLEAAPAVAVHRPQLQTSRPVEQSSMVDPAVPVLRHQSTAVQQTEPVVVAAVLTATQQHWLLVVPAVLAAVAQAATLLQQEA